MRAKWIEFCLWLLPLSWLSLLLWDAVMFTAGVISLRASPSDPVLLLIRFDISIPTLLLLLFLSGSIFRFLLCLMRSDSGKVLLLKTGESRASGILSFTLVILFVFGVWVLVRTILFSFLPNVKCFLLSLLHQLSGMMGWCMKQNQYLHILVLSIVSFFFFEQQVQ